MPDSFQYPSLGRRYLKHAIASSLFFMLLWLIIGDYGLNIHKFERWLLKEDRGLELMTALTFLATAIIGFRLCRKARFVGAMRFYWAMPVLGILGVLDETSYGETFLEWYEPVTFFDGEVKLDSLHDLLELGIFAAREYLPPALRVALAVGILLVGGILVVRFRQVLLVLLRQHGSVRFVLLCIGLFGVSQGIDLGFAKLIGIAKVEQYGLLHLLEELLEFEGAYAMLFGALAIPRLTPAPPEDEATHGR